MMVAARPSSTYDLNRVHQHDWDTRSKDLAVCRACGLEFTTSIYLTDIPGCPGTSFRLRYVGQDGGLDDPVVVKTTPLPHHVVLKNGREDIVCACGEHFRMDPRPNDQAIAQRGGDAIQQWVAHYKAEEKR